MFFRAYLGWSLKHALKIIFLSQYCVPKCLVWIRPYSVLFGMPNFVIKNNRYFSKSFFDKMPRVNKAFMTLKRTLCGLKIRWNNLIVCFLFTSIKINCRDWKRPLFFHMQQHTQTKQWKSENEEKKFYRIGYWELKYTLHH